MLTQQDRLLDRVADDEPVYRWTTALNGFAVHLTTLEAGRLAAQPAGAAGRARHRPPGHRHRRPGERRDHRGTARRRHRRARAP